MTKRAFLQLLTIADVDLCTDAQVDEMLVDFLSSRRFPAESPYWMN